MKNIHVFAAELPDISVLESKVAEEQGVVFIPLTDNQWSNLGFKVERQFVALDNGYRIDFTYSAKDYPKAQVIERVNEVIEVLPHDPCKEEAGKITEEVNADFCARSIAKTVHFSAFYHSAKQTLIFDCKAALAQRALGLLLKLVESIETKTLHCSGISNSLTTNMLAQLGNPYTDKLYFAGFEVGDLLVMQNKDKDVARFKGDYPTENIKELIEQGYEIKEIALSKDGIHFNLDHNFKIKGIKEQFQVEEAMFDNADDYEIHKQTIALELMTSHCEQLRTAFDKQSSDEDQQASLDDDQDDGNESLIAEHNAKYQDSNGNDKFYEEAKAFVQETQHASVLRIQRKFRIGYNRAARLVEQLEANGIVTEPGHNGERTVLIK